MASSSTEGAERSRRVVIEPYELLSKAPKNRCVQCLEAGVDKNKRSYPILVYFDNDEHTYNGNQKAVCHYNDQWCALGYDKQLNKPLVGKPIPEIHQYDEGVAHYYSDILPRTQHYSNNEPERGEEPGEPECEPEPDPTSFLIRHSRAVTPISSRLSSPFRRVPTPIRPHFHTSIVPANKWLPIAMSQTTAITTTTQHTSQPVQTTSAPAASSHVAGAPNPNDPQEVIN